ncbi:APC family permease [Cryptosporangium aurantiacum]|uniref:Amino acid transporter n=1 Tax=Cryptosporangium aurantiacum TaxID=134849 RepID=A0A1M7PMW1_9ACTN|nr:APC family permease [Cryptosporangium aurantiacum]SHN18548.1 Amino acid transporter [Cryptosporangium aurantiacum]
MRDDAPDRITGSGSPGWGNAPATAAPPPWAPAQRVPAGGARGRVDALPPAYPTAPSTGAIGRPRRRPRAKPVGIPELVLITTMTHAPLVMLWSVMPTTYQFSGVVATPLVFGLGGGVLLVFAIAYGGLARRIRHSGGLYAFVTHGLGPTIGLGVAVLAVLSYSVLLGGVLVLLAGVLTSFVEGLFDVHISLQVSLVIAVAAVVGLGRLQLRTLSRVYLGLAASQAIAVLWIDFGAVTTPDQGRISYDAIDPAWLLGGSVSLALCFALTSFMGSETGATYADEVTDPQRTVPRATIVSYAVAAVVLLVSGWAISVATGPENAVSIAQGSYESQTGGNGQPLVLVVVGRLVGPEHVITVVHLFTAALVLGALGASASIHHSVARQIAGLARDGVLPASLGTRRHGGTPVRAGWLAPLIAGPLALVAVSVDNTAVALVVGVLGGLGIVAVLTLTSLAAVVYFLRGAEEDDTGFLGWEGHLVAGAFAMVVTGFVFVYALIRLPSVLADVAPAVGWLFPVSLGGAFVGGVVWALVLRTTRPEVLARVGRSEPSAPE